MKNILNSVRNAKGDTIGHIKHAIEWHGGLNWARMSMDRGAELGYEYKQTRDENLLFEKIKTDFEQYLNKNV